MSTKTIEIDGERYKLVYLPHLDGGGYILKKDEFVPQEPQEPEWEVELSWDESFTTIHVHAKDETNLTQATAIKEAIEQTMGLIYGNRSFAHFENMDGVEEDTIIKAINKARTLISNPRSTK